KKKAYNSGHRLAHFQAILDAHVLFRKWGHVYKLLFYIMLKSTCDMARIESGGDN
ncbi:hypothetical protein ACJX0J_025430, partial [Zea mays]